jgi:hypothetical protein
MTTVRCLKQKYLHMAAHLNERGRRAWAATEAKAIGYGGISLVQRATRISRVTITSGIKELDQKRPLRLDRIRHPGGGRKSLDHHFPDWEQALENLVEPLTRGDPESPLRWTCKSTRRLADELISRGIQVGRQSVARSLIRMDYSLQGNRKIEEVKDHPDRNAQFENINARIKQALSVNQPVISVDTKKKELIGNYKNNGRTWHRKGKAPRVNTYDFPDPEVPRAHPYGVLDLGRNEGFVNVGTDRDTSSFAVASIRMWWRKRGRRLYPKAKRLLITADSGGSNGCRRRLWKWELQRLADETGIPVRVCHFPPGTSKWNKVEHRLFSFISMNWRGQPLLSYETVVKLIAATTTKTGLKVRCCLDKSEYPLGREVSDGEMASLALVPDKILGEWNYEIRPRKSSKM